MATKRKTAGQLVAVAESQPVYVMRLRSRDGSVNRESRLSRSRFEKMKEELGLEVIPEEATLVLDVSFSGWRTWLDLRRKEREEADKQKWAWAKPR